MDHHECYKLLPQAVVFLKDERIPLDFSFMPSHVNDFVFYDSSDYGT